MLLAFCLPRQFDGSFVKHAGTSGDESRFTRLCRCTLVIARNVIYVFFSPGRRTVLMSIPVHMAAFLIFALPRLRCRQ